VSKRKRGSFVSCSVVDVVHHPLATLLAQVRRNLFVHTSELLGSGAIKSDQSASKYIGSSCDCCSSSRVQFFISSSVA
jgi:hypothetical protein